MPDFTNDEVPHEFRRFHEFGTKIERDWIYYGGHNTKDSPPTFVLVSPQIVYNHKRIVCFSDGSGETLEEEEFVRLLSEELKRK